MSCCSGLTSKLVRLRFSDYFAAGAAAAGFLQTKMSLHSPAVVGARPVASCVFWLILSLSVQTKALFAQVAAPLCAGALPPDVVLHTKELVLQPAAPFCVPEALGFTKPVPPSAGRAGTGVPTLPFAPGVVVPSGPGDVPDDGVILQRSRPLCRRQFRRGRYVLIRDSS